MGEVDGEGMILTFFLERFLLFFCFFLVVLVGGGGATVTVDDSLVLVLVHELEEEEMVSERLRLKPGAATASTGALALHMPHRLSWGLLAYVHREQDHDCGCSCSCSCSSGDGGAVCATCSKAFSNDTVAGEVGAAMVVPPRVLICGSMANRRLGAGLRW